MFKTYYYIRELASYLKSILDKSVIRSVFTQEKDKIVIHLISENLSEIFLEFSVNNILPYLVLKDSFKRAAKNSVDILEILVNKKIISVEVMAFDRILLFNLSDNCSLYFVLIPQKFNLHIVNDDKIVDSFKNKKDYIGRLFSTVFEKKRQYTRSEIISVNDYMKNIYQMFGELVHKEVCSRLNLDCSLTIDDEAKLRIDKTFSDILEELEKPEYILYSYKGSIYAALIELRLLDHANKRKFGDINSLNRSYISSYSSFFELLSLKNHIFKNLDNKIKILTRKVGNLENLTENQSGINNFKNIADYLMANLHNIPEGSEYNDWIDLTNNKIIKVKLKKSLSIAENANYYYGKYKRGKKSLENLQSKFNKLQNELKSLREKRNYISVCDDLKILKKMDKQEIKSSESEPKSFRIFRIDNNYEIWVGKNSASNDLLTTKYSSQNDLWFHVRGSSGSHTVLKTGNKKDKVPGNIIKIAASVAAYYSKARKAGNVPVAYSEKKYVKKKKGLSQGQVIMEREKVVFVRPSLPDSENIT